MSACHAGDPGSIPGSGAFLYFCVKNIYIYMSRDFTIRNHTILLTMYIHVRAARAPHLCMLLHFCITSHECERLDPGLSTGFQWLDTSVRFECARQTDSEYYQFG